LYNDQIYNEQDDWKILATFINRFSSI